MMRVAMVLVVVIFIKWWQFFMSMIAVNNMRGHMLMQDTRDRLNAEEATDETAHHQYAGGLIAPVLTFEVTLGFWQHAIQ